MGRVFGYTIFVKLTSTTDIASPNHECYLVKFCELVYFVNEPLDVFMIEALTTVTKSLTREFEEETHKKKNKVERIKRDLLHKFLSNLLINIQVDRCYIGTFLIGYIFLKYSWQFFS